VRYSAKIGFHALKNVSLVPGIQPPVVYRDLGMGITFPDPQQLDKITDNTDNKVVAVLSVMIRRLLLNRFPLSNAWPANGCEITPDEVHDQSQAITR
jgi:hypothetical protein